MNISFISYPSSNIRSRRRRKTEKEEDEEILKDESGESDEQLTVFTESPACKIIDNNLGFSIFFRVCILVNFDLLISKKKIIEYYIM